MFFSIHVADRKIFLIGCVLAITEFSLLFGVSLIGFEYY